MDTVEVFTQIIHSPLNTTAERVGEGVLRVKFVVPVLPGIGEMHVYNVGDAGQQEITKAITGGIHLAKPEDIPDA